MAAPFRFFRCQVPPEICRMFLLLSLTLNLNLMQFLTRSFKMKHEHLVEKKDKDGNSIYENGCCNG
ncbi:hypothetical protein CYOC110262_10175 [Cytobacillus oceanisediminis]|uniref:Uncharacterized protein n=1 Tax=Cytobacillus oceanisediminis TaxID=665099 RepID=A0A562K3B5_9BACI|nr:hypothetical protein IQ19_00980 [Cytobacillus oceanisediminis]